MPAANDQEVIWAVWNGEYGTGLKNLDLNSNSKDKNNKSKNKSERSYQKQQWTHKRIQKHKIWKTTLK